MIAKGGTSASKFYLGSTEVSKIYKGDVLVYSAEQEEPIPYQRVEYLASTGTQYINTGILVTYNRLAEGMVLEMKMSANGNAASGKNNRPYFFVGRSSSKAYSGLGYNYKTSSVTFSSNTPYVLKLDSTDGNFYVNGTVASSYSETRTGTSGNNIALFAVYNTSAIGNKYSETIYWCKITYNGELVRDFVPCRIGTTGYMYDRVSGELFGNSGTDDFILGADV